MTPTAPLPRRSRNRAHNADSVTPAIRLRPWRRGPDSRSSATRSGRPAELGRLAPVLLPVTAAAAAAIAAAAWSFVASAPDASEVAGLAALLIAAIVAEAYPVPIEGVAAGRTSLATVFIVATAALYGWAPATLVAAVTMTLVEAGRRRPASRVAYNTALYALAASAAGLFARSLEGTDLLRQSVGTVFGSVAFYVVNISLLGLIVARSTNQSLRGLLRRFFFWTAVPFWIMASLTVILVVLWDRSPFVAVVLVGPVLAIALYERRVHAALNRLRELDHLKDEFIAVVSHELRTPLASVYGAAMTLERPELDEPRREAMLEIVYRESARLARLVDQVLWASRLEAGRTETTIESLDAAAISREVVEAARAHLPSRHSLELACDDPIPPAAGDPERVKQVLFNLVENALKYSPEGGRVEVKLQPSDGYVRFTVTDEGLGIPASEQQRIFEKFHRLDPNLTRGVGGTGLGLYICNELVQHMGGRIWVSSVEGEGSAFSFELPRADAA